MTRCVEVLKGCDDVLNGEITRMCELTTKRSWLKHLFAIKAYVDRNASSIQKHNFSGLSSLL